MSIPFTPNIGVVNAPGPDKVPPLRLTRSGMVRFCALLIMPFSRFSVRLCSKIVGTATSNVPLLKILKLPEPITALLPAKVKVIGD